MMLHDSITQNEYRAQTPYMDGAGNEIYCWLMSDYNNHIINNSRYVHAVGVCQLSKDYKDI
jgi:hypothetical protein